MRAGGPHFIQRIAGRLGGERLDGVGHHGQGLAELQQAADSVEHANLGDYTIDNEVTGVEAPDDARESAGLERVDSLLLDHDLLRALYGDVAVAVGHRHAARQQGGFGFVLADGASHAMFGPGLKFDVVFGMGVGGGDHLDAVLRGVSREMRERGDQPFGAGDVQRSSGVEKIELRIDVDEE